MLSGLRGRPPWPVRGWACLGARFNKAGGPGLVSGKVRPVEGSCSRPVGEGNASSHRYARLRQQLQRAGHAEAWGHRQQPARVVPIMGPLEEQRRLFVPPGPGKACRWLPHSHLSACFLPLQYLFPLSSCASALGRARRGRVGRRVMRLREPNASQSQESSGPCGRVTRLRSRKSVPLSPKLFALGACRNSSLLRRRLKSIYKDSVISLEKVRKGNNLFLVFKK